VCGFLAEEANGFTHGSVDRKPRILKKIKFASDTPLRTIGNRQDATVSANKPIHAKSAAPRRLVMSAAARKKISQAMKRSHAERKATAKK
jgi:hypothetical protein